MGRLDGERCDDGGKLFDSGRGYGGRRMAVIAGVGGCVGGRWSDEMAMMECRCEGVREMSGRWLVCVEKGRGRGVWEMSWVRGRWCQEEKRGRVVAAESGARR